VAELLVARQANRQDSEPYNASARRIFIRSTGEIDLLYMLMQADVSGKTVLITGANSGIGFETSVAIARLGAEVVMVARDPQRGEDALAAVRARSGSAAVSLLLCDMASLTAVRGLAAGYRARHSRLDVLVNNAGSVNDQRRTTEDGVERTFATNYLGSFLLTNLLLDLLKKSAPARVINVSSIAHRRATLDFDNLQFQNGGYSVMGAYGRSKLAQILFTRELAERLKGTGVTVNAVDPGTVGTNIWSHAPWFVRPVFAVLRHFMLPSTAGAEPIVRLATGVDVEGQSDGYYERFRLVEAAPLVRDSSIAKRLWDESVTLTRAGIEPAAF
jgi:NAD(P)-dependent dehydrogenase (short-subunit alcohol dehydrogenase family)